MLSGVIFIIIFMVASAGYHYVDVNGIQRRYLVHEPAGGSLEMMPVVIMYHGGGGNPRHLQATQRMDEIADREKFLVVYPCGSGGFGYWRLSTKFV